MLLAGWRHPDHGEHPCECLAYSPRGDLYGAGTSVWTVDETDGGRTKTLDLRASAAAFAWGGLV